MRHITHMQSRLPDEKRKISWHDTCDTAKKYLGNNKELRERLVLTRTRMQKLATEITRIELTFWKKVLLCKDTPEAGLRVAIRHVCNLSKDLEISVPERYFAVYKKSLYRQIAIQGLTILRTPIEERRGGYSRHIYWPSNSQSCLEKILSTLKKGDLTPRDIGITAKELEALVSPKTNP